MQAAEPSLFGSLRMPPAYKQYALVVSVNLLPPWRGSQQCSQRFVTLNKAGLYAIDIQQLQGDGLDPADPPIISQDACLIVDVRPPVDEDLVPAVERKNQVAPEPVVIVHGQGRGMRQDVPDSFDWGTASYVPLQLHLGKEESNHALHDGSHQECVQRVLVLKGLVRV